MKYKYIKGYNNRYIIYEDGDIFNVRQKRFVAQDETNGGYKQITLNKDGKSKKFYVHRLVAEYFLNNSFSKDKEVNHKDFNKKNNHYKNLEWVTPKENIQHLLINKGKPSSVGERNGMAKLSDKEVYEILTDLYINRLKYREVSVKYNISIAHVNAIKNGKKRIDVYDKFITDYNIVRFRDQSESS